jgi:hypothetical protein
LPVPVPCISVDSTPTVLRMVRDTARMTACTGLYRPRTSALSRVWEGGHERPGRERHERPGRERHERPGRERHEWDIVIDMRRAGGGGRESVEYIRQHWGMM